VGRVNELLGDVPYAVPPFEIGGCLPYSVNPIITIASCERTEKERIVLVDAYAVTVSFDVPERDDTRLCYAYAAAIETALAEDCTLGGVVDRVLATKKTYIDFRVALALRVIVEGLL
jgi:hypothetical protein